jgi:hypothetical protein
MHGRRGFAQRFDDLVQRASEQLAGRQSSRRGFLSGLGVGAAALAGSGLLRPSEAQAACALPAGCFGTEDVNVCYSPWKCVAAEPGRTDGIILRKGPQFSAAPVLRPDGSLVVIPINAHFARVSNRTGSVSQGCPDPGPRPNQSGFLWGYWIGYGRQGWIPYSVGGVTYSVGDNAFTGTLCGPAGADFDCRKAKSACSGYVGCGGASVGDPTCSETYRPIIAVGSDLSEEKYYLRYGANSTTFFWLVPGDRVKRWGYKVGGAYNWSCVQVICAAYAPNGCRGWVRSDALGAPDSNNTPCYPSVSCPAGSSG